MRKIVGLFSALFLLNSIPASAQESVYYFRMPFERPSTAVVAKGISDGNLTIPDLYVGETVGIHGTYVGGDGKVSWRNSGSPLPAGLSLSDTGFLGGIPLAGGTYSGISFELTDELNSAYTTKPSTIRVYEPLNVDPVIRRLVVGKSATIDLNITGGKSPYTAAISSGVLPNGLTLSGTRIRGTPTIKGIYNSAIRVSDSNGRNKTPDALIEVYDALFATSALSDGYVGLPYSASVNASGGEAPYIWYLSSGVEPSGLTFHADGRFSGTPVTAGVSNLVARVADGSTQFFELPISLGIYQLPDISTVSIPDIYVGETFQFDMKGGGGRTPVAWGASNLPSGISISPSTGKISGVATTKETVTTTVKLSDFNGKNAVKSFTMSTYNQLALAAKTFADAYVGMAYDADGQPPVLSGGKSPITWSASGLPTGLTMNASGQISGVPTVLADSTVTIFATDANSKTVSRKYGISTKGALALQAKVYSDPYVGVAYTASEGAAPAASGGKAPYAWSAVNLPQGLSINSGTGVISGVPSLEGSVTSTITVTDVNGKSVARAYDFAIRPQIVISSANLDTAIAGITNVNYAFTVAGGKPGYSWSITGKLPTGLALSSGGVLSGVPTVANTYSFAVVATDANARSASQNVSFVVSAPSNCTAPWGATVNHGATTTAYSAASVPFGNTCTSQTRTCTNGTLSGSYTFGTCSVAAPSVCTLPWGGTLAHGASTTAYQTASVPWNGTCSPETRTCNNGTLSGSYSNKSCAVTTPDNCTTPWGGTVNHGSSITAFQAASVPSDGTCTSQTRTCTNGTLSGSYTNSTCVKNCTTPWGTAVNSGSSVTAYQAETVAWNATCTSQSRTCTNGTLSGTYANKSCAVTAPLNCTDPWGGAVNHGSSVTAYQAASVPWGGTCTSQARTCTNGVLSGTYSSKTCAVATPTNCTTPWGATVNHGASTTAYQTASVPSDGTCTSQTRTCTNGTLSGTYANSSCVKNCSTPWGTAVNHGAAVTAFQSASVPWDGTCTSQSRTCNNGTLSGTYANKTCAVTTPLNCTDPWGGAVSHGTSVTAYQAASVPWNGTCTSQARTCTNGVLSGTYTNKACAVTTPLNCTAPWGGTVNHGSSITAFQAASVPSDGTCTSQSRTCTNGVLSGTYTNKACVKNCTTPWGAAVNHGAAVTAYQAATVAWNATCTSQSRTCSNGTLSGTYANKACTVTAPLNCTDPWGAALAHGSSVTAYQSASVPYGSTCVSQARTCTNGVVSGSYASKTCAVSKPKNCTVRDGTVSHGVTTYLYSKNVDRYCNTIRAQHTCTDGVLNPAGSTKYLVCNESPNSR